VCFCCKLVRRLANHSLSDVSLPIKHCRFKWDILVFAHPRWAHQSSLICPYLDIHNPVGQGASSQDTGAPAASQSLSVRLTVM
jgi:hypothetical protein